MSGRLKMKCARIAVGYAKDDYWLASYLTATIFGHKFTSARNQMLLIFIYQYSAVSNNFASTFCTVSLKLRYHDVVAFRTKKFNGWAEVGHWLTANFTFPAVTWKILSDHFQCPCDAIYTFQVSVCTSSVFLGKVVLVFEIICRFLTFKLFSIVKWLR